MLEEQEFGKRLRAGRINPDDILKMLLELHGNMKMNYEAPEKTPVQQAREAWRRYASKSLNKVYARTMKSVGNELEFVSSSHVIPGVFGLYCDVGYSLWDQADSFLESKFVRNFVKKQTGRDGKLVDFLKEMSSKVSSPDKKAEHDKSLETLLQRMQIANNMSVILAEESAKIKKSPDAYLKSAKNRYQLFEKAYGSFEAYKKERDENNKKLRELLSTIDEADKYPLADTIKDLLISLQFRIGSFEDYGVNPAVLGNIGQEYVRDVLKFARAYAIELQKESDADFAKLKKYHKPKP